MHYGPAGGRTRVDFDELWRYKDLIWLFVKRDFTVLYKQTVLGPAWILINPLLSMAMYTVMFGTIANLSTGGVPQPLFYLAGTAVWTFFSSCINKVSGTFTTNSNIFSKVYFPRLAMPISTMLSGFINFLVQFVMFFCLLLFYVVCGEVPPNWAAMPLLLPIVLQVGLLGLGFQGASLEVQFLQLIPDAHQVFLGALQLALGLLLLVAAVGDPRRLLKDLPPLGALGGEDLVDAALADEGVPLLAQAGVHEEFIHIPQADGLAVEEVFTLPGAVVPPGDRHLLPPVGEEIPALFQGEGDLGKALAAAGLGPAEDHILHLAPPEGFGGLLPQNPADGVGEVGLSAAVGPHDGGDGMLEGEDRPVRKGLEPLQFQRFQPQGVFLLWVCRDGFGPRPGSRRRFRREMGMIHFIIATPRLFCNG